MKRNLQSCAEAKVEALRSQEEIEGMMTIGLPTFLCQKKTDHQVHVAEPRNMLNNTSTIQRPIIKMQFQTFNRLLFCDSGTSEFAKFLLKRDLLFAHLSTFTEEPEAYLSWKGGFQRVMNELSVDAAEEIELLMKLLGPISSTYARSIKISDVNNPVIGRERLWERLDDRYECPELIEEALKQKLDRFPMLSNKDYEKLYELTDILAEIQSIKEDDQYHDLLAYYDTSSGVVPIVRKLPNS